MAQQRTAHDIGQYHDVWVFIEQIEGKPHSVSWELLGVGRQIAKELECGLAGVLLGHNVEHIVPEAFAYGAEKVYLIDDPVLEKYRTEPYLQGVASLVEQHKPEVMLLGATTLGRDLAGAVATHLRTGLTADCTGLSVDTDRALSIDTDRGLTVDSVRGHLLQTRPAFGGNIMATIITERHRPQMATVRPRVMAMPEPQPGRTGEVIRGQMELTEEAVGVQLLDYLRDADTGRVGLPDAEVIVAGGRGLGGPESFGLLEDLAEAMGGVVGASRGAVDAGWIGADRQVGQTGQTVRPKVYVAVGISGAIQHLVGMQTSDVIVAINLDPESPIFKVATYGIVGDFNDIVPALARQFREKLPARSAKT